MDRKAERERDRKINKGIYQEKRDRNSEQEKIRVTADVKFT